MEMNIVVLMKYRLCNLWSTAFNFYKKKTTKTIETQVLFLKHSVSAMSINSKHLKTKIIGVVYVRCLTWLFRYQHWRHNNIYERTWNILQRLYWYRLWFRHDSTSCTKFTNMVDISLKNMVKICIGTSSHPPPHSQPHLTTNNDTNKKMNKNRIINVHFYFVWGAVG